METMVERVAKAMFGEFDRLVRRDNPGIAERVPPRSLEAEEPRVWDYWVRAARLGIEAMREPTDLMVAAIHDADFTASGPAPGWQAGIDAALAEPATPPSSGRSGERG